MLVMSKEMMEHTIEQAKGGRIYGAFMVKDSDHNTTKETDRIKTAINILGVIHDIHKVNDMFAEMGREFKVDTEIFHLIMDRVLNPTIELTQSNTEKYFNECRKLESVRATLSRFSSIDFYLPNEVEYMILGLTPEEVTALKNCASDESFEDVYFQYYMFFIRGQMEYEKFITSVTNWIEAAKSKKAFSLNVA